MEARVKAAGLYGAEGRVLEVTASTRPGLLPGFEQRGLPRAGLGDRAERVWSAVTASGLPWPTAKVTVTAARDRVPVHEHAIDLAIAVAVLAAADMVAADATAGVLCYAGLRGDGVLQPVPGVLPAVAAAVKAGCRAVVVAAENAAEAALVPGITVTGASRLAEVTGWLRGGPALQVPAPDPAQHQPLRGDGEIRGNAGACLAAEVSAAGGHHLWISGPRGSAARLLAARVHRLLPPLDEAAALEVTAVHSVAGLLDPAAPLVTVPPFAAALPGLGLAGMAGDWECGVLSPGDAAIAHRGVLFLDRAPEFSPEVLDTVRRSAASGTVTAPLPNGDRVRVRLPARFILIAADLPCQCPGPGSDVARCACPAAGRDRRDALLSRPFRDRFPLRTVLAAPSPGDGVVPGEPVADVAARVAAAREHAAARLAGTPWWVNAEVPRDELLRRFTPGRGREPISRAAGLGLVSGHEAADTLRVAWTIADLAGHPSPTRGDCATALGLRMGDLR